MPEFVHQDCVKLVCPGGAYKDSCALKSLPILSTGSITTFLPTSKIQKKECLKKWMVLKKIVFPQMFDSWCDILKEVVNK